MDISNISNSIDENLNIGKELEKNKQIEIFDSNQISTDSRLLQQNEDEVQRKKQGSGNLLSNKQVGAGDEISQMAARILAQKKLEEAQSPEEIRRLLGEFAGKDVNQLEPEQKKQWIRLIRNSESLNGEENKKIRELIDMLLFLLPNQAEVAQNQADLQLVIKAISKELNNPANLEQEMNLTKLEELVQSVVDVNANREIENQQLAADQDVAFSIFEEKQRAFFQQIEQSPLYDEGDKLRRKREYYLAYSERILQGERGLQATAFNKIKFRCDLDRIEKELADYTHKKELVETSKKRLKSVIDNEETDEETRNRAEGTLANLEALSAYGMICADTRYKNQLIALDEKQEKLERWDADKTLHKDQSQIVRNLDLWLLDHEPKSVKDKCFIAQFMGCTVRERLAMYLCVEMNNKNVDKSLLTFSQMNYKPSETLIIKNLKSFFGDGVHWSKMRKAYEFVTSQSAHLDLVIEDAKKGELDPLNTLAEDEIRRGSQFTEADSEDLKYVDEQIKAISKILLEGQRLPAKKDEESKNKEPNNQVLEAEQLEVEQNNQVIANDNQQEKLTPDAIKNLMKQLRGFVKRKAELEKDPVMKRIFKQVTRGFDYYNYASMVHTGGDLAVGIARTLAGGEPNEKLDVVNVYADRTDYFMAVYATPIVNLIKLLQNVYTFSTMDYASGYTKAKNISGAFQSTFTLADSLQTAGEDIGSIGTWEERYRKYRETMANGMKKRSNQGLGAMKFDIESPHTIFQLLNTATTACSTVFDCIQTNQSGKACKTIRDQIERRRNGQVQADMEDATYRQEHYKLSMTKLVDRLNSRRRYTTTFNVVTNLIGYAKYVAPLPYIGLITSGVGLTISSLSKLVDHFKKKNSNNKTVDEFLNLDDMIREYRNNHQGIVIGDENKFRERFRRNAMLQLGFANSKTFLAHVMQKLAEMMHSVLSNASKSRDQGIWNNVKPIKTIVESLGLLVSTRHIPKAKEIAAKLAI